MCFHLALNLSDSLNTPEADEGFGVSACKSCGSLYTGVIGLSFKIYSTPTRNVLNTSLFKRSSPTNESKILLMERIRFPILRLGDSPLVD